MMIYGHSVMVSDVWKALQEYPVERAELDKLMFPNMWRDVEQMRVLLSCRTEDSLGLRQKLADAHKSIAQTGARLAALEAVANAARTQAYSNKLMHSESGSLIKALDRLDYLSVSDSAAASTGNGEDQVGSAPPACGDERAAALPAEDSTAVESAGSAKTKPSEPIPMLLWCPECKARHVDAGAFKTKVHHTHSCQACGHTWRPAVVPTVGVQFLPGFRDEP